MRFDLTTAPAAADARALSDGIDMPRGSATHYLKKRLA